MKNFLKKTKPHLLEFSRRKTTFLTLIALAILAIPATVFLAQQQQEIRQRASNQQSTKWMTTQEKINKGLMGPRSEIMQLDFSYNESQSSKISVVDIQRKVGYAKRSKKQEGYRLEVLNNQEQVVYVKYFQLPRLLVAPPPLPGEKGQAPKELKEFNFSETIAYNQNFSSFNLYDPKNEIVLKKVQIPQLPAPPPVKDSTKSIEGSALKAATFDMPAPAPLPGDKFDVVIVSNLYTDQAKFESHAQSAFNNLLTFSPFAGRADQVTFHTVFNTSDLGCVKFSNGAYGCDATKVTTAVNNAGLPHDNIGVLNDDATYGGGAVIGSNIEVVNFPTQGPDVYVHELGHAFGGLFDEYTYDLNTDGVMDNALHGPNCWAGAPPAPAWNGIVPISDYTLGCSYRNWYRSSSTSIMLTLSSKFFNAVSQKALNKELDNFTPSLTPTPTGLTSPVPTGIVIPTPTPTAKPTPTTIPTVLPTSAPASIAGYVFKDTNQNGVKDTGELGYYSAIVSSNAKVTLSTGVYKYVSTSGYYSFTGLTSPKQYSLTITVPPGYIATSPTTQIITTKAGTNTINFGIFKPTPTPTPAPATLSGYVFKDTNQNGIKDIGELGYYSSILANNAKVTLSNGTSKYVTSTGYFTFTGLKSQTYTVTVTMPSNYKFTTTNPKTATLKAGANTLNVGVVLTNATPVPTKPPATPTPAPATISGYVFKDTNKNGIKDTGEYGYYSSIYPAKVTLSTGAYRNPNTSGFYSFTALKSSTIYTVSVTVPTGYVASSPTSKTITTKAGTNTVNFGIFK